MLEAGDRIASWVVVKPLGEGGMGSVYLCHSAMSDRIRAAVKVLKATLDDDQGRFVREVEALDALRHPSIVQVKGFGHDPAHGAFWLAMEYVAGEDLEHRRRRGPMSPEEALRVFAGVADGLAHAHANRICHRDIKPANILLCPDGSGRIVDFGIAVQSDRTRLTQAGIVVGTPAYMAPEIFEGDTPDLARVDVYALGQVLHEALVGEAAFPTDPALSTGQAMMRLIGRKTRGEPLDPGPGVPEALREIVRRATAPRTADRYKAMAELATALAAARDRTASPTAAPVASEVAPPSPPPPASSPPADEGTSWVRDPRPEPSRAPPTEGHGPGDLAPAAHPPVARSGEGHGPGQPPPPRAHPAAPAPHPAARRGAGVALAGGGVALVAGALAAIGLGVGAAWWFTVGRLIDTEIEIVGLEEPVRAWLGELELERVGSHGVASPDGIRFGYHGPAGTRPVQILAGPHCTEAAGGAWRPGSACPACCQCETFEATLADGEAVRRDLVATQAATRAITVAFPRYEEWPTYVAGDANPLLPVQSKRLDLMSGQGPVPMFPVIVGWCGSADIGCSDRDDCPAWCASSNWSVDAPCGTGPLTERVVLAAPPGDPLEPYLGTWKRHVGSDSDRITVRRGANGPAVSMTSWVDWGSVGVVQLYDGAGRNVRFVDGSLEFEVQSILEVWDKQVLRPAPPGAGGATVVLLDRGAPTANPARLTR